ncbi:unnamed protein product [Toxocara canis]|uniref:Secreted protein n=1 Tax=Toxocara canis TaxID=6265 RepID=A0A183UXQ9_TOXCA|nr:unnamed protein product [Toxocara canis]
MAVAATAEAAATEVVEEGVDITAVAGVEEATVAVVAATMVEVAGAVMAVAATAEAAATEVVEEGVDITAVAGVEEATVAVVAATMVEVAGAVFAAFIKKFCITRLSKLPYLRYVLFVFFPVQLDIQGATEMSADADVTQLCGAYQSGNYGACCAKQLVCVRSV